MRKCRLFALTLALVLGVAPMAAAATLKVGTISPLTGPYAADGNDIVSGTKAAVDVIMAEGGIPGFEKIEVLPQDDACDPRQAVAAANKLVNEKVAGVVGAYCSSATIPASEVLAEENIPMLTPASTNEKVTERGLKHMWRVCGRDDDQSKAAMAFIKELKAKTIFIVDDKTTYSQGLADNVAKLSEAAGLKVERDHVNEGDKDFSAVLTKIKAANPDVFYMSLQNSASGALMLIQAKRAEIKAAIIGQDAVYHPQLIEVAKDAAEGVYLTFGYIDEASPSYQKFLKAYEKYGKPGAYSGYAYDAAYVLLTAIKKAGGTDPMKIREQILKMDFPGATKHIKFAENGDSGSNYIIRQVKGGAFVNYWDPQTGKKY